MFNAELNCFKTYGEAPALQDEYVFFPKIFKSLDHFFSTCFTQRFRKCYEKTSSGSSQKREKIYCSKSNGRNCNLLQQIHQEINNKFIEVCNSSDRICQAGPPGPAGALGYPGYKGEKGASEKVGPPGPSGPIGAPGVGGKRGPVGPQGVKGDKGDKGSVGAPGIKGDTGAKGRHGQKGSIGLKGNKGIRGLIGIQGPKGECDVPPKIIMSFSTRQQYSSVGFNARRRPE